jgi:hypothetical protein
LNNKKQECKETPIVYSVDGWQVDKAARSCVSVTRVAALRSWRMQCMAASRQILSRSAPMAYVVVVVVRDSVIKQQQSIYYLPVNPHVSLLAS